jgi:hypothetical protein
MKWVTVLYSLTENIVFILVWKLLPKSGLPVPQMGSSSPGDSFVFTFVPGGRLEFYVSAKHIGSNISQASPKLPHSPQNPPPLPFGASKGLGLLH